MQNYEIQKVRKGFAYDRNGFVIKGRAGTVYSTYEAAVEAAQAMPERTQRVATPAPAPVQAPQADHQAQRVSALTGLPAARATGRCHYCGLPLVHGECEECV